MSEIERAIGAGIVRESMPGGWAAGALAETLGPVFGAFVGAAAFDLRISDDAEGWRGFLAALLAGTGPLPFVSPLAAATPGSEPILLAAATPGSEPILTGELAQLAEPILTGELAQLAQRLAQFLGFPLVEPDEEKDEPETAAPGRPEPENLQASVEYIFAASGGPISQEDKNKANELRTLLEALQTSGGETVAGVVSPYAARRAQEALRAIARWIARIFPEMAKFEQWIELELLETLRRAAIAQAIALAADKLPFNLKSTLQVGSYVHRRLQRRYVQWQAGRHDIAIERWSPVTRREEQVVIGPATDGSYVRLSAMVTRSRDPDGFWQTLRVAMNGAKFTRNSWLRADLVDRQLASIWEIKPVNSGPAGVWQEAYYRVTFNLIRPIFHLGSAGQPLIIPGLRSGGFLVDAASPRRGVALPGSFALLNPIDVTQQAKEPAVAVPFQVSLLPGLILYIVLRGPNLRDLLKVLFVLLSAALEQAKKFLDNLAQSIRQGLEAALEEARKLLDAIGDALEPALHAVGKLILLLAALAFGLYLLPSGRGVPLQPTTAPGLLFTPGVGPGGGGSGSYTRRVPRSLQGSTLASVTHDGGRLSVTLVSKNAQRRGSPPTTSFHSAFVDVHGIPEDAVADFLGFYFGVADDLMKLTTVRLGKQLAARREAVV